VHADEQLVAVAAIALLELPDPFGGLPTLASNSITRSYSRTISPISESLSIAASSSRSIRPANLP